MKIFYFVLLVFLSFDDCFSQDSSTSVFHLNKLPAEGVLLDKGWKFRAGDNPDYAKPEYDDRSWKLINPTLNIPELPKIAKSGIGWFRLHLLVDSTVDIPLIMMIQQSGASEIYLNGKLVHRFGILSADPNMVKAFNPLDKPVSFPLSNVTEQVLAVRYALQPSISYSFFLGAQNKGLNIIANTAENAFNQYLQIYISNEERNVFKVGVFLILAILYLAFFLFYPTQRVNLLFSLYAFLQAANFFSIIFRHHSNQVEHWLFYDIIINIIQVFGYLIMLFAIYRLFEEKRSWIYYSLLVLAIICIPLNFYIYGWGWMVYGFLFTNLFNFEITRIAFKAIRNRKKGAWIIAAGGIGYLVFWILFTFNWMGYIEALNGAALFDLAILSVPIAVSIYLGYDLALTNRSLQQKLTEVEKLSKENLEMEKNKQAAQIEAMVVTQEQERKRISRDLHDDVGTKLSALSLLLSSLDDKANYTNNHEIRSLAQSSRQFIKETMHDVRQLLLNLSPTVLEEFGYTTAVEGLVNKINETKQIHFDLVVFGIKHRLKKDYELALYRITQELINNVLKHAEAKHVSLQIGQRDEKIILMMEDDGKGFDVNAHKEGYGLNNLDARTKLMQGTMTIDSQPGKGTSVLIEIPYHFNEV